MNRLSDLILARLEPLFFIIAISWSILHYTYNPYILVWVLGRYGNQLYITNVY